MTKEESKTTPAHSTDGTLNNLNDLREQPNSKVNRRHLLKRAGMFLGAIGVMAALAIPAVSGNHKGEEDANEIVGLWQTVISAPDNSFPPFKAFELWGGGGTFSGSGQPDLTPAALASTAWGAWKQVGERKFRMVGRFWTYNPDATPSGFAALDFTVTVSKDGKTYHGEGTSQFFDNNGNSLGPPSPTLDDGTRITFP